MKLRFILISIISAWTCSTSNAQIPLVNKGKSAYTIIIPENAADYERKAAGVLQRYLQEMTGVKLPVQSDREAPRDTEICIGMTNRKTGRELTGAFAILTDHQRLLLIGRDKNSLYAVYHFLDHYLGCRKWAPGPAYIPKKTNINLPAITDQQQPQFTFRQVYYPAQYEAEYLDWHKLQLLDEEFGLWGHTFDKLVPPETYFETHPEYYALVNGQRKATQLCLSNTRVLEIVVKNLGERIADDPGKKLWSVSQNDGFGYCTCTNCQAYDVQHGGPQASVINFANKVALRFPGYTISTMAYLYSRRPPVNLEPVQNLSIMLSAIDVNRALPIAADPRTASFRNDLKGWTALSKRVMIWDYVVQFTNYLSPFPNLHTLQANLSYFAGSGIGGAFLQGTEITPGEFSELKTYLLSRLSWDPGADISKEQNQFMQAWYGAAAPALIQYQQLLEQQLTASKRPLDIYGDPTSEWNSWLKPEQVVQYDKLLAKAENAVDGQAKFAQRVAKERLSLEFAVLQQARFYGLDRHGLFTLTGNNWQLKPGFEARVKRFAVLAEEAGIKTLNEQGQTPKQYADEWTELIRQGPVLHRAIGSQVRALTPYHPDYPGKGLRTLIDGTRGYQNFQYNYLGWLDSDMEVLIDLGQSKDIDSVSAGFLESQRHWAFLPRAIEISVSDDSRSFAMAGMYTGIEPEENYQRQTLRITVKLTPGTRGRYIRFKASKLQKLPEWRDFPNRKSWLFCDEIAVY